MSEGCPFCHPPADRLFYQSSLVLGLWDAFPVSPGHALLVPRRHVAEWFEATPQEHSELLLAIEEARWVICQRYEPAGFNIGVNVGAAAGQTIPHLHVHLIPRYSGDVPDPRGGVRYVIPAKANYLRASHRTPELRNLPHRRSLVTGSTHDPLLPHLLAHLDRAIGLDMAVSFIMESGVNRMIGHLRDLLARGGRLRLLFGDYLGITDPGALLKLMDLEGLRELRIFQAGQTSFHPKSYLLHYPDGTGTAFVGSSNLSESALRTGVEWNYRVVSSQDDAGFSDILAAFDALFAHPQTRHLDFNWVRDYESRRRIIRPAALPAAVDLVPEPPPERPTPHAIQQEALAALNATRAAGNTAGLVVLATGLGKTWLSAFDSDQPEYRRILFVAHREEILTQAMATFRRIRPLASIGRYNGQEKAPDADLLFASIQTLGRQRHLDQFARDAFDYLIVDEFHHASAPTYRRLIDYFTPRFLLGLTATPERTDGGNLLTLCQENLVYRCDLVRGIEQKLLCPFRYVGVPDEVDYANIPWRSNRFEEEALTQALATQARAANALEQYHKHGGKRTLAFCCSQRHADFMADYFRQQGIATAAVHSGPNTAPRATALEQLESGELSVLFAVDMFNEGLDLPAIDTVMMLRPTESTILWLQQFGRGLRAAAGKEYLRVVDYIGNHRTFLLKPRTLLMVGPGDQALNAALRRVESGEAVLPEGCSVIYELEALDILRNLLKLRQGDESLRAYYEDFRERNGQRPLAVEMFHDGYSPHMLRQGFGSWFRFVKQMGDFSDLQTQAFERAAAFLEEIEVTPMTRSFKMLTLQAMLNLDRLPGEIGISHLVPEVRRLALRSAELQADFKVPLDHEPGLQRYLEKNPIEAWISRRDSQDRSYFTYESEVFRCTLDLPPQARRAFQEMAQELVEWRLAEYLRRSTTANESQESVTNLVESPRSLFESPSGPEMWRPYMREKIPPLWGFTFNQAIWNVGFVPREKHVFLLVTLQKEDLQADHRYADRFLSPTVFEWQSQNSASRDSSRGQIVARHQANGTKIHLFVRRAKKISSKSAPFIYCGEVTFLDWEGDKPITVRYQLSQPVPATLQRELQVPAEVR